MKRLGGMINGRHRKADTKSKGSSANQPNTSSRGAGSQSANQGAYCSINTRKSPGFWHAPRALPCIIVRATYPGVVSLDTICYPNTDQKTPSGKWCLPWMYGELSEPNNCTNVFGPPHLHDTRGMQSEGIVAGEIIAWRAWHWNGSRLRSIFVDYEWPPGEKACGRPDLGYGIHAFKDLQTGPNREYGCCSETLVYGQVALWGDVIEFERGYIAEFGRIISLNTDKTEIMDLYGIKYNLVLTADMKEEKSDGSNI